VLEHLPVQEVVQTYDGGRLQSGRHLSFSRLAGSSGRHLLFTS
jgi:hypothetical protein